MTEVLQIWEKDMQKNMETKKELFTVGEYWTGDVQKLHRYITETEGEISLFDVPLHYKLSSASKEENYDLSQLLDNTLVKENSSKAVTFVDNHDVTRIASILTNKNHLPLAYGLLFGMPGIFLPSKPPNPVAFRL